MGTGSIGDTRGAGNVKRADDGAAAARERPADRKDAERFDNLVRGGNKRPGDGDGEPAQPDGMASLFGQAAQNLAGLAGQQQGLAGAEAAFAAAPAASVNQGRCEELVERILVSQPAADAAAEVRIKVDETFLPDTEIRLVRTADAGLSVEFMTDEVDAQRFLLPNLSELRGRLAERTGDQVVVRMSEQADAGADTGDGRSRNRRNLYEEMGDNR